jgi:hypothetical protein
MPCPLCVRINAAGNRLGRLSTACHWIALPISAQLVEFALSTLTARSTSIALSRDQHLVLDNLAAAVHAIHVIWSLAAGAWLGVGNDSNYNHSDCFDPFPFPSPGEILKSKISTVADALDAFRKQRQHEHPGLTLTQMYGVLEKLKTNVPLDKVDEAIKDKGLIVILKELHEDLDRQVGQFNKAYLVPVYRSSGRPCIFKASLQRPRRNSKLQSLP